MTYGVRLIALSMAILLGGGVEFLHAGEMADRAKAAGDAHRFGDFSNEAVDEALPIDGMKDPPQAGLTISTMEDAALEEITSDSVGAKAHGAISNNFETWLQTETDDELFGSANEAVASPEAFVGEGLFSSTGSALACTVASFDAAPEFHRTCDRNRNIYTTTCTDIPDVQVRVNQRFACIVESPDPQETCTALQAEPHCEITETLCQQFVGGECLRKEHTYSCNSPQLIDVAVPQIGATSYDAPTVSWRTICAPDYDPSFCTQTNQSCSGGATVEYVHGIAVPLSCRAPTTGYQCVSNSYTSDCETFTASDGCTLTQSTCLLENNDGQCGTYEDTYTCGGSVDETAGECSDINVCVGEICQSIPNEVNDDFVQASAYVGILNDMALNWRETEDIMGETCEEVCDGGPCAAEQGEQRELVCTPYVIEEGGEVVYFSGNEATCRKIILGALNCCNESGWADGIFGDCRESELVLLSARQAGSTVYMRTYCSKKALFVCLIKKREYCVFGSKLGRVLNTEVQRVQGLPFECRALTQSEMETIDWSLVDLSPVYKDMLDAATLPNPAVLGEALLDNIENTIPVTKEAYE